MNELDAMKDACIQRHAALNATVDRLCRLLENGSGLSNRTTRIEEHMKAIDENLERGSKQFASITQKLDRINVTMILLAIAAGGTLATKLIEAVITGKL